MKPATESVDPAMQETNLFMIAPQRPIKERLDLVLGADLKNKKTADFQSYGYDYWDNPEFGVGYGGYHYDGRYEEAVKRFAEHFDLKPGDSVLEIGCAKGFVLYEFHRLGMKVTGVDASQYAIDHAKEEIRDRLLLNQSAELPFETDSFDFVLGKEVLPHLEEHDAVKLISECMRVARGDKIFFEIQCAETEQVAEYMKIWDMTHQTMKPKQWWEDQLRRLDYKGAYHCKMLF